MLNGIILGIVVLVYRDYVSKIVPTEDQLSNNNTLSNIKVLLNSNIEIIINYLDANFLNTALLNAVFHYTFIREILQYHDAAFT